MHTREMRIDCLGEELAAVGDEGEGEAGGFVGSGVEEPPVAFGVLSEGGDVTCGEFGGVSSAMPFPGFLGVYDPGMYGFIVRFSNFSLSGCFLK